ncbi:MAG: 4-(cytidine 5'-diphospho)-2-C-methyl-D-erythritol kinase [Terriglobales bacterium]|jgi:4-diphosphocytidyl-2-C-methyl-D-erythritol kinase
MTVLVRSFAKINLGLYIGAARADGYHDLRTVYQTIALHDVIRVSVVRGGGIEILCKNKDPRVPLDSSNTCYRMAELVMDELGAKGRVSIEIEKRLPVQGGLGAASSNAVATMVALEFELKKTRVVKKKLSGPARLRIAAEVGSDLPLFLVGGTTLGVGRGEEVYPLPDLPAIPMVIVTPEVGVSTAQAFADWDALVQRERAAELRPAGQPRAAVPTRASTGEDARPSTGSEQLTRAGASDRLFEVGRALSAWLSGYPNTGASAKGGSRAGSLLSDLVRTGIENDFEKVVFPQYPELRDIKGALERAGSRYASLSGSGSTLYGLFRSSADAAWAANRLRKQGVRAEATSTLTRQQYWKRIFDC